MSHTPRCDEFEASLPTILWSGNETDSVRAAVYGLLAAWITMARGLERELATGHLGLTQEFVDRVTQDDDDPGPDVIGPAKAHELGHRQTAEERPVNQKRLQSSLDALAGANYTNPVGKHAPTRQSKKKRR